MFDFDLSKMILVGVVALVVVGPKQLPAVLRALARALATLRGFHAGVRKTVDALMADADLDSVDRALASLDKTTRNNIALNPATAMRGSLPSARETDSRSEAEKGTLQYVSPEMLAYLAPPPEAPALATVDAAATSA